MSFGQSFGGASFRTNGNDIEVGNKAYPGVTLNPNTTAEANGFYTAFREVNGAQWLMQNADFNASGQFFQINQAYPSKAFVQLSGGGIATYTAPAGSQVGFTWTRQFYVDNTGALQSPAGGVSLAPGAAIANIGPQGLTTTYLAPANLLTQIGTYSVKDVPFNAQGNGTTDDSAAILAAANAANAHAATPHGSAVLYFPPGIYYYNSSTPITISPGVNVYANGALIIGGSATTDCLFFVQTGGNQNEGSYANSWLSGYDFCPSIHNFPNGKGIRVNTSSRNIFFPTIDSCLRGISLEVSQATSTSCLDNNITGNAIQNCTTGIYNYNDNAGAAYAQGNVFEINFVVACKYSIHWAQGTGTSTPAFTINLYKVHAIDPAAAAATSYVFFQDTNGYSAGNRVTCDTFLAPATTTGAQIFSPLMSSHFHCLYELCFAFAQTVLPTVIGSPPIFSRITPLQSIPNTVAISNNGTPIPAGTTTGVRGTGTYPTSFQYVQASNNIFASLTVKAGGIASGGYQDCWVYCDLINGSSLCFAAPSRTTYNVSVMAEDASAAAGVDGTGPFPGMIHCRIYNNQSTSIAASSTINFIVLVGGAP